MPKIACITGASEGLGRVFATQLAERGYETINIARNEARLQELVASLGEGHRYWVADLSKPSELSRCVELMAEQHIDVLINNAGFSQFGVYREASLEDESKILHVNCQAVMSLSHAFLTQAQEGDILINLSSITNILTTPIQPTYCATKSFIASLSESLWYQERKRGVYVQGLLPGITRTQFIERSSDIEGFKKQLLDFISQTPEAVVKESLRAADKRRKPIVIPGLSNKLLALLLNFMPRKQLVWLSGKVGDLA